MKMDAINIRKSLTKGFTLLEILVALAIFALVSVSCYRQIDASFRASTRIEQKYLALWIVESKMDEIFIERKWPLMGETRSEYKDENSKWIIKTNISETEIKSLRKIEMSIYSDEKDLDHAILTLTRFVGEN